MARWGLAATGGVVVLIAVLSGVEEKPVETTQAAEAVSYVDEPTASDEPTTLVEQPEVKGGETYAEYDIRRNALGGSVGSYRGYGCIQDCSGHDAGYQWAEDNDVTDPDDCGGKSWSFEEGCRSFAEERQEAKAEEGEGEEE